MSFEIITEPFKWAAPVRAKHVYRDQEYVATATKEEALEATEFLCNRPQNLTYTTTVYVNGEYRTYYLFNMPCLGGWVKYKDTHGDKYSMNPYFPRDISVPFPDGDIVFLGLPRFGGAKALDTPYYNFILSDESPWIAGFNKRENILIKDKHIVLTDMSTDPTVFYSLLRQGDLKDSGFLSNVFKDPRAILLHKFMNYADPRRLAGQKPHKISGGTWAEGYGYTRPYNDCLFHEKLPLPLSKFHTLSSEQPTHSPANNTEYMYRTMKREFGLDLSTTKLTSDHEGIFIDAWAFFKKAAKDLKD